MSKEEKNHLDFKGFEEFEPLDTSYPEKELLRAILVGALNDIKKKGHEKRKATEFFLSPEDDYIFSFLSICDYLRVSPNKVLIVAGLKDVPLGKEASNLEELKKEILEDSDWD